MIVKKIYSDLIVMRLCQGKLKISGPLFKM